MNTMQPANAPPVEKTDCPYCGYRASIALPADYAPVFVRCGECRKRFIIERMAEGFKVWTAESAPCCSNPECREIEMGSSDEQ